MVSAEAKARAFTSLFFGATGECGNGGCECEMRLGWDVAKNRGVRELASGRAGERYSCRLESEEKMCLWPQNPVQKVVLEKRWCQKGK